MACPTNSWHRGKTTERNTYFRRRKVNTTRRPLSPWMNECHMFFCVALDHYLHPGCFSPSGFFVSNLNGSWRSCNVLQASFLLSSHPVLERKCLFNTILTHKANFQPFFHVYNIENFNKFGNPRFSQKCVTFR